MRRPAGSLRRTLQRTLTPRQSFSGADLSSQAGVEELMGVAHDAFGPPTILVNNAVVRTFSPVDNFPVDRCRCRSVDNDAADDSAD